MANEKKKPGKELGSILKSKMAPPVAKCIVAYIPTSWLKKNMYKLELGTPVAWIINLILPDEGFGQDLSDISNDILSAQIIEMAKDKLRDWDNAKNKLQSERLQSGNKTPVADSDYSEFKKFLTFPDETFDFVKFKSFGTILKSIVGKIKVIDWSKINLGDWDTKLIDKKIPEKIDATAAKIDALPGKPFTKETKISKWIDRLSAKI